MDDLRIAYYEWIFHYWTPDGSRRAVDVALALLVALFAVSVLVAVRARGDGRAGSPRATAPFRDASPESAGAAKSRWFDPRVASCGIGVAVVVVAAMFAPYLLLRFAGRVVQPDRFDDAYRNNNVIDVRAESGPIGHPTDRYEDSVASLATWFDSASNQTRVDFLVVPWAPFVHQCGSRARVRGWRVLAAYAIALVAGGWLVRTRSRRDG